MLQAVIIALVNTVAFITYLVVVVWEGTNPLSDFTVSELPAAIAFCAIVANAIPLAWWVVQRRTPTQIDRSFATEQLICSFGSLVGAPGVGLAVFDVWSPAGSDPGLTVVVTIVLCGFFVVQAIFATAAETTWWVVRRRRRRRGRCPSCDYDLAAGSDRCPECGEETPLRGGTG